MAGPLQHIQVVELAQGIAGPYAGMLMADFGADVIKVEPPGGDRLRFRPPFADHGKDPERSGAFVYVNTNKRSIAIDLDDQGNRRRVRKLIARADILIIDEADAWLAAHDLAIDDLRSSYPRLIVVSTRPFGRTGPYRDYEGDDLIGTHSSTMAYLSRPKKFAQPAGDIAPLRTGGNQATFFTGLVGTLGAVIALYGRRLSGHGQLVDVSMQESVIASLGPMVANYFYQGHISGRASYQPSAPINLVRCKDGFVWLQCSEELHWRNFVKLMGSPDWADLEIFRDRFTRGSNWDVLEPLILEWTLEHGKEEIFRQSQALRVPHAPAYTFEELLKNAQLLARGYWTSIDQPGLGTVTTPGAPFNLTASPWRAGRAPLLGEHTAEILAELDEAPHSLAPVGA